MPEVPESSGVRRPNFGGLAARKARKVTGGHPDGILKRETSHTSSVHTTSYHARTPGEHLLHRCNHGLLQLPSRTAALLLRSSNRRSRPPTRISERRKKEERKKTRREGEKGKREGKKEKEKRKSEG